MTSPATTTRSSRIGTLALPALADLVAICVFVAIGRRSHDEAGSVTGFLTTLWPFLVGAAVGWCVTAAATKRRFAPSALVPAGVAIWVSTVIVGMLARVVSGQGTATSFVIVATVATAVLLLGWRAITVLVVARRGRWR